MDTNNEYQDSILDAAINQTYSSEKRTSKDPLPKTLASSRELNPYIKNDQPIPDGIINEKYIDQYDGNWLQKIRKERKHHRRHLPNDRYTENVKNSQHNSRKKQQLTSHSEKIFQVKQHNKSFSQATNTNIQLDGLSEYNFKDMDANMVIAQALKFYLKGDIANYKKICDLASGKYIHRVVRKHYQSTRNQNKKYMEFSTENKLYSLKEEYEDFSNKLSKHCRYKR